MYGHPVRGPLDILKEEWEAEEKSDESVVSYVLSLRERLESMAEHVQENLRKAQRYQKAWYDRNARERSFQPGDQVLILLPVPTNKLMAQWQGPYPVLRQVGSVTYEVDVVDRRKRKRILHVNMLRKWCAPAGDAYWAEEVANGADDEIPTWDEGSVPKGGQLNARQQREIQELLSEYPDVARDSPRRTSSEWASPMVLMNKKDGTVRLCVNYRRVNAASAAEAYPLPRIDDIIDQIGRAQYLTTIDLTKGYWQVPVASENRHNTAFWTPFGLFEFNVMPFGLQGAPGTFQRLMDGLIHGLSSFASG